MASTHTYKAVRIHAYGGADKLQLDQLQSTQPGKGQVLVRVAYAGVNFIDTYQRSGLYKGELPLTLGREASGTVTAVGEGVTDTKVGQRVAFMTQGCYSELVTVNETDLVPIPQDVSLRDAAALLLQALTADYLARSTFKLQPGHWALIHAAAGGTGALLVQMAKAAGAHVIATAGSDEKLAEVRSFGADVLINYKTHDWVADVKHATDGKGVHVAYDGVGKATWEGSLKCLRPLGMLVLFGNASGPAPPVDPLMLSAQGSVFMTRPILGHYISTREILLERTAHVFSLLRDGKIRVRIGREYPLDKAADAQIFLESRASRGKIVLTVDAAQS